MQSKVNEPVDSIKIDYNDFNDIVNATFPWLNYEIVADEVLSRGANYISDGYPNVTATQYKYFFKGNNVTTHLIVQCLMNIGILEYNQTYMITVSY